MGSSVIFYGPGARQAALNLATDLGFLLAEPFGDEGLKVEQAREVAELLRSAPISDKLGVVVIGPLDDAATSKSSDALLKALEEPSPYVRAVLWAEDLGGVPATIRSRCTDKFAPPGLDDPDAEEDSSPQTAWNLLKAYLEGDYATIVDLVESGTAKDGEKREKKLLRLVSALADVLSQDLENSYKRALWERVREVARWRNPTPLEVISALVGSGEG